MLNDTERRNLDLIRIAEASKHSTIQPGDMRYWRDRLITAKKLGTHSGAEWKVLVAEVEAIHGKRFDDEPWLQQYFEERYWYQAEPAYDSKSFRQRSARTLLLYQAPRSVNGELHCCRVTWSFSKTKRFPRPCCAD